MAFNIFLMFLLCLLVSLWFSIHRRPKMLFSSTILLLCSLFTWSAGGYAFLAPSALTPHTHLTAARRTTKSYNPLNSIIGEQSMRTPLVNKVTTALSSSRTDDDEDDDDSNLEPLGEWRFGYYIVTQSLLLVLRLLAIMFDHHHQY